MADVSTARATAFSGFLSVVVLPWNAFVAAFVYYTLLTLVAIGVEQVPAAFMVVSYLMPVVVYVVLVGVRALASVQIDIGHAPQALQH